jgi:HPt (histidine-containing phosphotransfer) domain-containing protein
VETTASRPIDYGALLEELGGQESVLHEMLGILLQTTGECRAVIRRAHTEMDYPGLASAAHKIKGALVAFGARSAAMAAADLELQGRGGDLVAVRRAMARLEDELDRLRVALEAFVGGNDEGGGR